MSVSVSVLIIVSHHVTKILFRYSGVHHLRKELIEWSIKYLKEYPTRRSEACIKRLQSWITMSNNLLSAFVPINYEEVHKDGLNIDLIRENDMIGLLRFVQHSDSSGYLSKGETIDFHDVLQKIMPYAELKDEDDTRYYQELTSLVEWCVKNGRGLQFH